MNKNFKALIILFLCFVCCCSFGQIWEGVGGNLLDEDFVTHGSPVPPPPPTEFYNITYLDFNGNELASYTDVAEGTVTPMPEDPIREMWVFNKWVPDVSSTVIDNATYTASYTIIYSEGLSYTVNPCGEGIIVASLGSCVGDTVIHIPPEVDGVPVVGIASEGTWVGATLVKELTIPDSLEYIGKYGISRFTNLEYINPYPDSITWVAPGSIVLTGDATEIPPKITKLCEGSINVLGNQDTLTLPASITATYKDWAHTTSSCIHAPNVKTLRIDGLLDETQSLRICHSDSMPALQKIEFNVTHFLDWVYHSSGFDSYDYSSPIFGSCIISASSTFVLGLHGFTEGFTVVGSTITGITDSSLSEIYIPKTINGIEITEIATDAFRGLSNLTLVLIDNDGIDLTIDDYAFADCASLSEIIFTGNNPPSVSEHTFNNDTVTLFYPYYSNYKDTRSASVTVNNNWNNIPAFWGGLTLNQNNKLGYGGYKYLSSKTLSGNKYILSGSSSAPYRENYYCPQTYKKLKTQIGPNSGGGPFKSNLTAKKLVIPQYTAIGSCLAQIAYNITEILYDDTNTFVGTSQFDRTAITSLLIPNNPSVTAVPGSLAMGTRYLTSVTIPANITSIGSQAFGDLDATYYCGLQQITFLGHAPSVVKTASTASFKGVDGMYAYYPVDDSTWTSVVASTTWGGATNIHWMPVGSHGQIVASYIYQGEEVGNLYEDGWLLISAAQFEGDRNAPWLDDAEQIVGVEFTDTARYIPDYCFIGTEYPNLETVIFGRNVISIGRESFAGASCPSLSTVDMSRVQASLNIGFAAFSNCENLASLTLPINGGSLTIMPEAFSSIGISTLTIPDNTRLAKSDTTFNLRPRTFADCRNLTNVVVGNNVYFQANGINECGTFIGCASLTSIVFGNQPTIEGRALVNFVNSIPEPAKDIQIEFLMSPPLMESTGEYRPFNDTNLSVIYHNAYAQEWEQGRGGTPKNDPFNKVFWGTDNLVSVTKE